MGDRAVGKCDHYLHEGDEIDEGTFEYKGCWGCWHFEENGVLMDVSQAANCFNVSPSTIIRWIKNGKLVGRLYERIRKGDWNSGPKRKYYIENKIGDGMDGS